MIDCTDSDNGSTVADESVTEDVVVHQNMALCKLLRNTYLVPQKGSFPAELKFTLHIFFNSNPFLIMCCAKLLILAITIMGVVWEPLTRGNAKSKGKLLEDMAPSLGIQSGNKKYRKRSHSR